MEMHTPQSLYEIHGISVRARPRSRWIARVLATVLKLGPALQATLRARRAAAALASMDDHMLQDIGISRGEIESVVRRRRARQQFNLPPASMSTRRVITPERCEQQTTGDAKMLMKMTTMALAGALIVGAHHREWFPNSANGGETYDLAPSTELTPRAWQNGSRAYDFVPAAKPCPTLEGYPDCH